MEGHGLWNLTQMELGPCDPCCWGLSTFLSLMAFQSQCDTSLSHPWVSCFKFMRWFQSFSSSEGCITRNN